MGKFRKTFYWLAAGFVLLGVAMVVQGLSMLLDEHRLESRGAQTTGEVESLFTESFYSASRSRMVDQTWIIVGYWVDEVWYGNRFQLSSDQKKDFERGQLVTVVYDPENPANGRPAGLSRQGGGRFQSIFGYLMMFVGIQTLLVLILKPRPALTEHGQAAGLS